MTRNLITNRRGAGLIFVVLILVVVSLVIAAFVSLINTESFTAMNQSFAVQTFGIAEGGVEYALKKKVFPNYSTAGSTIALGAGTFELLTPAYLTAPVVAGNTTITVDLTAAFPATGKITIDSEVMTYTSLLSSPPRFSLSTGALQPHANNNSVYPVTALNGVLNIGVTTVTVNSTTGYTIPGVIAIDDEHIYCATVVSTTQFGTCARAYNGTTDASHASGTNVFQYVFRSKGLITSIPVTNPSQRIVKADMTSLKNDATLSWTFGGGGKNWVHLGIALRPSGTISFGAASSAARANVNSWAVSHTVPINTTIMIIGVSVGNTSVSSITTLPLNCGGSAPALIGAINHPTVAIRAEQWYILNPTQGACIVTVNLAAQSGLVIGVVSMLGVDTANPFGAGIGFNSGTSSPITVKVPVVTPNAWVVDTVAVEPVNPTAGAGQTQRWSQNAGALVRGAGSTAGPLFSGATNMRGFMSELY